MSDKDTLKKLAQLTGGQCVLCRKDAYYVGLFVPTPDACKELGVEYGTKYGYGVCKTHLGQTEAIEEEIKKRIAYRKN